MKFQNKRTISIGYRSDWQPRKLNPVCRELASATQIDSRGIRRRVCGRMLMTSIAFVTVVCLSSNVSAAQGEATSGNRETEITQVEVDDVWAANRAGFALQTVGQRQYIAYYDRNRMMTVASRKLNETNWQRTTLPNKLMWDSHNRVVLGVDPEGYVHVSGNMHVHPLCYFRSQRPHDISRMEPQPMVGREEDRVTYPRFFSGSDGALLFSYRYGTCGDGNILINRFDPAAMRWVRHLHVPLFEGVGENKPRAAYHRSIQDDQGRFHFVWMWRWTPKVETCHQLCYASTDDLIHWTNAAGQPVELPFRPDMPEVIVDDVRSKGGLHNSRYQIIISPSGDPRIGYVKYDDQGMTQTYLAKPDGQQWLTKQMTNWNFRWEFIEGGDQMTIGGKFQLVPTDSPQVLAILWETEREEFGRCFVDFDTLKPTSAAKVLMPRPEAAYDRMTDDESLSVNLQPDASGIRDDGKQYLLKWETRESTHARHAPKVIPAGPLSKLVVLEIR